MSAYYTCTIVFSLGLLLIFQITQFIYFLKIISEMLSLIPHLKLLPKSVIWLMEHNSKCIQVYVLITLEI